MGDHHENAVTLRRESFCGKGAEAYSLSGRFPVLSPLWFFFPAEGNRLTEVGDSGRKAS